jgi:hypothetical protein
MKSIEHKNTEYMKKDFNKKLNIFKRQQEAEQKMFEVRRQRNHQVSTQKKLDRNNSLQGLSIDNEIGSYQITETPDNVSNYQP